MSLPPAEESHHGHGLAISKLLKAMQPSQRAAYRSWEKSSSLETMISSSARQSSAVVIAASRSGFGPRTSWRTLVAQFAIALLICSTRKRIDPSCVNEKWEKAGKAGNLVSFHRHAVVWATHYSQLSRCRKRIKPRFRPILGNKSGVRFDALKKAEDVCKAVRYQAKMPARGYRTVPQGWGKKTQTSAKLSYVSRYRLFTALQQYDLLDFWLAGGEGATILREARTKLHEHRERQRLRSASKSQPQYRSWMSSSGVPRLRAF
jgi:hypothetical protein